VRCVGCDGDVGGVDDGDGGRLREMGGDEPVCSVDYATRTGVQGDGFTERSLMCGGAGEDSENVGIWW